LRCSHTGWVDAIISLVGAALMSLTPAWLLSRSITMRMLAHDAAVSRHVVQSIIENLDAQALLPGLVPPRPPLASSDLFTQTDAAHITTIFGTVAQRLHQQLETIRISVYAPDGRCIWSTHPRQAGHRNLGNTQLVRALIGELAVRVEHTSWNSSSDEQARLTSGAPFFSEMYLPIWDSARESVAGVVELHKISDTLLRAIVQRQRWVWGSAIVVGVLLYGILLRLIRQVGRRIKQRREQRPSLTPPHALFKCYAVLSLLFVCLLIVGPAWPLSAYIAHRMLERDATVTMQFVQTLLEDMDARAYLSEPPEAEHVPTYSDFFRQTEPKRINAIFSDLSKRLFLPRFDIVRISVYAPDGMRIWATQPKQVGIRWLGNAKLVRALNGTLAVDRDVIIYGLADVEQARITSQTPVFAEMYMPIWNPARDTVVGVVEVYKDSESLFGTIAQGQRWVWGGLISLGLVLLGVLLGIMRHALRIMAQQRGVLVASETLSVVGEMASAIAHLLRQPLATISAAATAILARELHTITPQGQDIRAEVAQLDTWLQRLQTYGQAHEHAPTAVALPTLVHDIVQHVRPSLDKQRIRLQLDVEDVVPPIQADATLVYQVLHTVITNAQDAMLDGGTLSIRATSADSPPRIDVHISDTGCGMTPEQLNRLFHPFFTTKRRGLGLGLALAKRVIERQGGTITIASTIGQGTTVTLSFPMAADDGKR
jgi:signal transduction histidine kinase